MDTGHTRTLSSRQITTGALHLYVPVLLSLIWFSLFLSHNLSVAHDSIQYLLDALSDAPTWQANSLFATPLMALSVSLSRALGLTLDPIIAVTLPNVLAGVATVQIVFLYLHRRLNLDYASSLLGAALPAVSFGTWYYSAAIEAYSVPIALMFLCLYLLADERRSVHTFIAVACLHSLAALFHQYAVLMGPLVCYAIYSAPHMRWSRKLLVLLVYTLITAVLVGGMYVLIGVNQPGVNTPSSFLYWLLGNATDQSVAAQFGGVDLKTLAFAVVGMGRAIIGGHFVFAIPELGTLLARVFGANSLDDERFLVAQLSPPLARALLATSLLWVAGLLACLVRIVRARRALHPSPAVFMVLWLLLPMTAVFSFYYSRNIDFWLVQSLCFWILLCWALSTLQRQRSLAVLLAGLLCINLVGTMQFATSAERDFHQWRAAALSERLQQDDLLIIGDWWPTAGFIDYLTDTPPIVLVDQFNRQVEPASLRALIDATLEKRGRVYIYDDIYNIDPASVHLYGPEYAAYVQQFSGTLADAEAITDEPGRQHRVIAP